MDITGLTVFCDTPDMVEVSLGSVRRYYPKLPLVVVDNSEEEACTEALEKFLWNDEYHRYIKTPFNIGHGPALNRGAHHILSAWIYVFDSDTEIIKENFLEDMLQATRLGTYAVGYLMDVDKTGQSWGETPYKYIHPLGCLVNMLKFRMHPPFISGGAPFIEAMISVNQTYEELDRVLINFPVHRPIDSRPPYCKHYAGVTRIHFNRTIPQNYRGY